MEMSHTALSEEADAEFELPAPDPVTAEGITYDILYTVSSN